METVRFQSTVTVRLTRRTRSPGADVSEALPETLTFIFGVERQVPALEEAVEGARVGDRLRVTVPAAQIYGERDPELIREIPKQGLIRQRLREGRYYRQMKGGTLLSFKVLEIRPQTVLADFNRPLAGITADVDMEVLEIRPAEQEEIERALRARIRKDTGCG